MDNSSHLQIEVHRSAHSTVLVLGGELDIASAPALDEQLEQAIGPDVAFVIVDLRGLQFMDSTGLATMIRAWQAARRAGRRFVIVRGSPQVDRLFELTSVDEQFVIVDAPEEVLPVELQHPAGS
jgi:anti-sigma B factor antagonist